MKPLFLSSALLLILPGLVSADAITAEQADREVPIGARMTSPAALNAANVESPVEDGLYSRYIHLHERLRKNVKQAADGTTLMQTMEAQYQADLEQNPDRTAPQPNERLGPVSTEEVQPLQEDSAATLFWTTTGNVRVGDRVLFLGTLDRSPTVVGANGRIALRIYGFGESPNLLGGHEDNRTGPGVIGATIGGGGAPFFPNQALSDYATVGGGMDNRAGADYKFLKSDFATVSGGRENQAARRYATVGGGFQNRAEGTSSVIAGGEANRLQENYATISGGIHNQISARYGTIAGGNTNILSGKSGAIAGGDHNEVAAAHASIGGGLHNKATGIFSTIPGGVLNEAAGDGSFAAGSNAKAMHEGSFVWGDRQELSFGSTARNQFLIRASGNVGIDTETPVEKLTVKGNIAPAETHAFSLGVPGRYWDELYLKGDVDVETGLRLISDGKTLLEVDRDGNMKVTGTLVASSFENDHGDPISSGGNGAGSQVVLPDDLDPRRISGVALTQDTRFSGDIKGPAGALKIQPAVIQSVHINTGAVHGTHLRDKSISGRHIEKNSISSAHMDMSELRQQFLPSGGGEITGALTVKRDRFTVGDRQIVTTRGKVGIGTAAPDSPLTVAGMIHTTVGGIKFPDGSIQTSAANISDFEKPDFRSLANIAINGPIISRKDGFIFPDGTVQTTAWSPSATPANPAADPQGDSEKLKQDIDTLRAEIKQLAERPATIPGEQDLHKAELQKLNTGLTALRASTEEFENRWQQLPGQWKQVNQNLTKLEDEILRLAAITASATNQLSDSSSWRLPVETLRTQMPKLETELSAAKIQLDALRTELDKLKAGKPDTGNLDQALTRIAALQKGQTDLARFNEARTRRVDQTLSEQSTLLNQIERWTDTVMQGVSNQQAEVVALQSALASLQEEIPAVPEPDAAAASTDWKPEFEKLQAEWNEAKSEADSRHQALEHRVGQFPNALRAFAEKVKTVENFSQELADLKTQVAANNRQTPPAPTSTPASPTPQPDFNSLIEQALVPLQEQIQQLEARKPEASPDAELRAKHELLAQKIIELETAGSTVNAATRSELSTLGEQSEAAREVLSGDLTTLRADQEAATAGLAHALKQVQAELSNQLAEVQASIPVVQPDPHADTLATIQKRITELENIPVPKIDNELIAKWEDVARSVEQLQNQPKSQPTPPASTKESEQLSSSVRILQEDLTLIAEAVQVMQPLAPALKQELDAAKLEWAQSLKELQATFPAPQQVPDAVDLSPLQQQVDALRKLVETPAEPDPRLAELSESLETLQTRINAMPNHRSDIETLRGQINAQKSAITTTSTELANLKQAMNARPSADPATAASISQMENQLHRLQELEGSLKAQLQDRITRDQLAGHLEELNDKVTGLDLALSERLTASFEAQLNAANEKTLKGLRLFGTDLKAFGDHGNKRFAELEERIQALADRTPEVAGADPAEQKRLQKDLKQVSRTLQQHESSIGEIAALQEQLNGLNDAIRSMQSGLTKLEDKSSSLSEQQKKPLSSISQLQEEMESKLTAQQQLLTQLQSELGEQSSYHQRLADLSGQLSSLQVQIAAQPAAPWAQPLDDLSSDLRSYRESAGSQLAALVQTVDALNLRPNGLAVDTRFDGDVQGTAQSLKLSPGSVGQSALLPNAVDSSKIRDGSVSLSDLDTLSLDSRYFTKAGGRLNGDLTVEGELRITSGGPAKGRILRSHEDGTTYWDDASNLKTGNAWTFGGNAGTRPAQDFIGTTDDVPLSLRVNNQTALRLQPNPGSPTLLGGHAANSGDRVKGAVISGGGTDRDPNRVTGDFASIGGGFGNTADSLSVVGGGLGNRAVGQSASVGGGYSNLTSQAFSTISGGANNRAGGVGATIGGGMANRADGDSSTVPGGLSNQALGANSFAAGKGAIAQHAGSFVWKDGTDGNATSDQNNQFKVQATGGVLLQAGSDRGVVLPTGDFSWHYQLPPSERRDAFDADGNEVLNKLAGVRMQTFQAGGNTHIAPDSRSFNRAFGLENSPDRLHAGDLDGVALAAIQGLLKRLEDQDQKIAGQEREMAALRAELQRLTRLVNE